MFLNDLLCPKRCPVCMSALPPGGALICAPCRKKLAFISGNVCMKCGKPVADPMRECCGSCRRGNPPFDGGITYLYYASRYTRRMIYEVKYRGNVQLLDFPCLDFAKKTKKLVASWGIQALIPVPVHRKRLRKRGFNQAEEIAKRLGKIYGLPTDTDFLLRTEETRVQKQLTREERRINLQTAFETASGRTPRDCVLLVDDILTSGATAAACAAVLKRAGIKKVFICMLSTSTDNG